MGEITDVIAGQSPPSSTYNNNQQGLPFFQGKVDFGVTFPKVRVWCNEPVKIAKPNDILISVRAPVGPTNICNVESCIGRGLSAIRSKANTKYKYVFYFLRSIEERIFDKGHGSTFNAITQNELREIKIPFPPLPIQKQIAEILEKSDEAKQKRKEANKLTDEFLQSVVIEMFGDPVKNPKRWEVKSFDQLVEKFQYGTSVKSSQRGLPVLRIPNIIQGVVDLSNLKTVELSKKEEESLILNDSDILFVRTNGNPDYVGRCALFNLKDKYVFASYLIRAILIKENVNSFFLVYLLGNSNYRNVIRSKCSTTAGQFNINTKGLGSLPIILPPLPLQQRFAEVVNKTEALKEKQKQSEQELENLFQSLMQKAFKGELNFN